MREKKGPSETAAVPPVPPETVEAPPQEATYVPVPPPPMAPPPPPRRQADSPWREGQWVLVAIAAVILIVIVAAGGFAVGYAVGNRNSKSAGLTGGAQKGLPGGAAQQGQAPQRLQRLQQQLEQRGASLVQGQVASVSGGNLTIDTADGEQTVSITENTRFPGAGAAGSDPGAGAGAQSLQPGESVFVVVKKEADGNLEALAVRPGPAGAQPAVPQQ
jgi:hypothetical protein